MSFNPLEHPKERERLQIRLDLKQKRGKLPSFITKQTEIRTKQAPLTKSGWSVTYAGAVSYKKLVLIIAVTASF